jgi:hypothetical protein
MSEILIGSNPDNPEVVGAVNFETTAEEKAKQLPKPSGYHILCAIPPAEKEFDSGIVKADTTVHYEELRVKRAISYWSDLTLVHAF